MGAEALNRYAARAGAVRGVGNAEKGAEQLFPTCWGENGGVEGGGGKGYEEASPWHRPCKPGLSSRSDRTLGFTTGPLRAT